MASPGDFESRRRERRRRERLRKKRIRAAVILIAFIGIIIFIVAAFSTCKKRDDETSQSNQEQTEQIEQTAQPDETVPTFAPTVSTLSIPPASEENDLLEIIRSSGESKHCYLTFDDGPTDNITPQILDTLRRYNVKATFFQIGSRIEGSPDMARRVYEEGHLIANHSNGHNYEKLYASTETFMNEVNECYERIKEITGEAEPFRLVRFPGGSFNSSADSYSPVKQQCKEILKEYGFYHCDWNALNGDAEGKTKNAEELLEYLKINLDGEDNVVVLMHDAAAKQATADALASIIEYFMSEGYTFHRLDDIDYQSYNSSAASGAGAEQSEIDNEEDNEEDNSLESNEPSATPVQTATTRPASVPSNNSGAIIIQ